MYILNDGHHRTVASYDLGKRGILSDTKPCFKAYCEGNTKPDNLRFYNINNVEVILPMYSDGVD